MTNERIHKVMKASTAVASSCNDSTKHGSRGVCDWGSNWAVNTIQHRHRQVPELDYTIQYNTSTGN